MFAHRLILALYYGTRGLMVLAFVLFLLSKNWIDAVSTALIFLLMTIPTFLKDRYKLQTPFELDVAIVVYIFLTLFLGSLRDYYERFPLFDGILHFQSGILLGMVGFILVYALNDREVKTLSLSPGFISFFSVTFSMAISVVWEIYEYLGDMFLGYNMQESGLPDTMGDFILNAIGALIVGIVGYIWMKNRKRVPLTPRLLKKAKGKAPYS